MTEPSLAERLSRLSPEQRARLGRMMRDREAPAAGGPPAPPGPEAPIPVIDRSSGVLPMSFAQRRHYFLQCLRPESPAYNTVEAVRLRGPLDAAALRAAVAAVAARHEVLRTRCLPGPGEPVLVADMDGAAVEFADLSPGGAAAAGELFARLAERPFDLEREAPLRVTLARLGEDDHALLLVVHHIASDAWSCRLLMEEIFRGYTGVAEPPLPVQYADHAAWQRARLESGEGRAAQAYWRERLAGAPPVLELPLERPRPAVRSDHGAELHVHLGGDVRRRLHAAARDAAVTPFALLLTAFGYVLHRHCATGDVVVATPVSGRDRVETERLVGCFVNTIVLRLGFGAPESRRDLVRRVWRHTLDDLGHQDVPFEHLVAELGPDRDLSTGRLAQVMVNYYPATEVEARVPGLEILPLDVARARAKFDLTCTVVDARDSLRVTLTYATDLLGPDLVARLGDHLVAVLEALLTDLDAPAGTLPPVPPGDPAPAAAPPARDTTPVLARFHAQVAATPGRVAVRCREEAVTYRELDERAGRLASSLRGRATPGGRVALLFERSPDYVAAILGALKACVSYVPLDPAMPPGHLAAVLEASGAEVVLTHAEVDATAVPEGVAVTRIEDLAARDGSEGTAGRSGPEAGAEPAAGRTGTNHRTGTGTPAGPSGAQHGAGAEPAAGGTGTEHRTGAEPPAGPTGTEHRTGAEPPAGPTGTEHRTGAEPPAGRTGTEHGAGKEDSGGRVGAGPGEEMYVLFTSGSTGRPKGVVVEHRHFSAYLDSVLSRMRVPEGLHFAIVSTFAADLGLTNLFGALATGGTLHVLPYEEAADPGRFAAYFRRHPIDFMKLVPSHLQAVAEAGLLADVVPARFLVLAGEPCPRDLVDAVRAARPGVAVWNHYGPTETTVSVLAYEIPASARRGTAVPLGFPLDHARAHVVDGELRPVPRGTAGELLITGGSVARGYLAADGAARFVRDPFSVDARAYRTGDRARLLPDGAVEFLGRLDRQAKIRGHRVEPSHVEAVLRRHPAVAEVAVDVRRDREGRTFLAAYYVPAPRRETSPGDGSDGRTATMTVPPAGNGTGTFAGNDSDSHAATTADPGTETVPRGGSDGRTGTTADPDTETFPGGGSDGRAGTVAVADSDAVELMEFARGAMPPYMVPGAWTVLERLPLTPNGKVDWAALPEPAPVVRRQAATPPRDARDARMCRIWAEVLGLGEVGIDDDFFESGGDSFTAMRLARRIGEDVRVISIFQHPTVRRLADHLGEGAAGGYLWRLPGAGRAARVTATVVAVPFGGGTAAAYAELARALPPEFPLYAVDLPGHDPARPDQPLEPFAVTAEGVAREIAATVEGPVVVYGHCVGAALAYDVARRVEASGGEVAGVVLGGAFPAPRLPGRLFDLWARLFPSDRWRSDRLYRDTLRGIGGLTGVLDPREQALTLRAVRHDARESEELYTRLCSSPGPRTLRALAVVGERDRITEFHEERYREWDLLCADTALAVIPAAGHFFLKHQPDLLAAAITGWADHLLGTTPAGTPAGHDKATDTTRTGRLPAPPSAQPAPPDPLPALPGSPPAPPHPLPALTGSPSGPPDPLPPLPGSPSGPPDPLPALPGSPSGPPHPLPALPSSSPTPNAAPAEAPLHPSHAMDGTPPTPPPPVVSAPAARPPRRRTRTPAANLRGFALVTAGQLVSMTGSRALAFALGIWVYLQTGSATQFSVILVVALLPGLLALPFAGAAADRWNRRTLLIAAEAVNAAGTGFCLVTLATGSLQVWHIYVAAALGSVATSFQQPAYLAAAAQLIPKRYLARANGVLQVVTALSQAGGPLLGGVLIASAGLRGAMLADLATTLAATVTLLAVRFPDLLFRRREESIGKEIAGGLRYIARRPPLVAMVVFFLGYNLMLGFALALLPPMVLSFAGTGTLSLATTAGALGGVAGGTVMALWGGFERRATGMVGFAALTGVGMVVAALRPEPPYPVIGLVLVMASIALINGHWQTMIQLKVGMELQGRVLATNRMTANLTEPLGYLAAGALADALFEPAMAPGGPLAGTAGGLLGTGPGRGMALMIVLLGAALIALTVIGLRWRTLRRMEDVLPDAIPGAVVTWDRDELQRASDARLEEPAAGR
ncbi:MFS transporter [Sphaerisporangium sp. B11E5]|uniref:MFS transporter n=1 Tax=Sphaerisporangium sp. B11E5 TaxID=3153563 RepID=UPI00325F5C33